MNLVIVESPAKAKTIKKYLGKGFEVLASYGHVRDLVPKEGAVDPDQHFKMKYQVIEKNDRHVQAIAKALKNAEALYLATDPDREGEAISWHLLELLKKRRLLNGTKVHRVVFNEITKRAIQEAVENPRDLSMDLINAQQARRAKGNRRSRPSRSGNTGPSRPMRATASRSSYPNSFNIRAKNWASSA
jgi:DNA topoisomerase-1